MAAITGTNGDDYIYATNLEDIIRGLGGNDILWGGESGDVLDGGDGFDTADYRYITAPVTVDMRLGVQIGTGDAAGDRLVSIESLTGTRYDDTFIGDAGDNVFRGGKGADLIDGGIGRDRASYAYSSTGVDVDLTRSGPQSGGDAAGDILRSIEKLTGSDHADRLVGDGKDNEFSGGKGGDHIDGGAGLDFVDYRGSTAVDIDLTRALQLGGDAEGDHLVSVEGVRGSTGADRIVGGNGAEHLIGDAGNDYIDGAGGDDMLNGGSGNNTLLGGSGNDIVQTIGEGIAQGGDGFDTLILTFENRDPLNIYGANMTVAADGSIVTHYTTNYLTPPNVTLTATSFERVEVHGTLANDSLTGTSGQDVILANAGSDYVYGTEGGDYIDGGDGYDTFLVNYTSFFNGDVTVDLASGTATGFAAVANFERSYVTTGVGNDHIVGGEFGNGIITGGGSDFVEVWGNRNTVDVNNGQDLSFETVIAGDGRDSVYAGHRGDLDGGAGLEDDLTLRLFRPGAIEVDGIAGTVSSGLTFQNFEILSIRRGSVAGDDTLRGSDNGDSIWGGGGNDLLEGRAGNDDLRGDAGDDVLTGGAGADQFVFSTGHDTVTDFNADEGDVIRLSYPSFNLNFNFATDVTDTADGALITSSATGATMLLESVMKADLTDGDFAYL